MNWFSPWSALASVPMVAAMDALSFFVSGPFIYALRPVLDAKDSAYGGWWGAWSLMGCVGLLMSAVNFSFVTMLLSTWEDEEPSSSSSAADGGSSRESSRRYALVAAEGTGWEGERVGEGSEDEDEPVAVV